MAVHISSDGNVAEAGGTLVSNVNFNNVYSKDEIDRACLSALHCPDSLEVKTPLKENKDKLLPKSFDWILRDPQYLRWLNDDNVGLLWIKGGAGKGKTMMSIGLIEKLLQQSQRSRETTVVTYFFCQNADSELNKTEAIIKGLILQLVKQQESVKKLLRDRWDTSQQRFYKDVSSWRGLWDILIEMLGCCQCAQVHILVDALDECQGEGMADLLKVIVRTGLENPSRIKWLLTSRPLDSAEQELLTGLDQVQVSLELNPQHISQAVQAYISEKAAELGRRQKYGSTLQQQIGQELNIRAEDTFLWVSLVCKRLEKVHRNEALSMIQEIPPGLDAFYDRMLTQLCEGESTDVEGCVRLLQVMMLAYRPLHLHELSGAIGILDDEQEIERITERSASFVKRRGRYVEFVHQSTRDYLAEGRGRFVLDSGDRFSHAEMAVNCLDFLLERLKVDLLDLSRPDATRETVNEMMEEGENAQLASLNYAATFWFQHVEMAKDDPVIRGALNEDGMLVKLFRTRFLEWLECLSLLDQLPRAVEAFKTLSNIQFSRQHDFAAAFVQDATRFLLRHYETVSNWPLQLYSSAIVFSPEQSVVRRENLNKVPCWLKKFPKFEENWTSLVQTLTGHSSSVSAVAFSPDGRRIASGSYDNTIRVWDATTGQVEQTLVGHSSSVYAVAFSPDGQRIASGSGDSTVRVWDATTGQVEQTLIGHSDWVYAVAFSPDGRRIASGSEDKTVRVWDATTGQVEQTLIGHLDSVSAVAFSPDGRRIASGSEDKTVRMWDATTGQVEQTLTGHSHWVWAVAFSLDGRRIASGSRDKTVRVWDATTGQVEQTLTGHSDLVWAVAFSPDGRRIASGSRDKTVRVWDATTGQVEQTLIGHSDWVRAVAFSPDGRRIASGSYDNTIRVWDATTGQVEQTLTGHSDLVWAVAFSPDGRRIASGSRDKTVRVWDATTGQVEQTLIGHSDWVRAVAFSPDGRRIASGSYDNTIRVWDATTGQVEQTLTGHSDLVWAVAFSPDGRRIASGSYDKTVRVWDATTGQVEQTLIGHSDWVSAVAFSPDGRRIASGSRDNTVRVWNVQHGTYQETQTSRPLSKIRFSADGTHLITNLGAFKAEVEAAGRRGQKAESSHYLYVDDQWICCESRPTLRLPADFVVGDYDVHGDQLAIGFQDGRVLSLAVDSKRLLDPQLVKR